MKPTKIEIDGQAFELMPPECRPPGPIADQETDAVGVWARRAGGPWHKTALTRHRAGTLLMAADGADAAWDELIAHGPTPAAEAPRTEAPRADLAPAQESPKADAPKAASKK